MGINDLPKPGINFKATTGPGNFQRKLGQATRYGELKNLRDNQPAVVKAIKKYEHDIRVRGGLSRLQRRSAWLAVKASDKTITKPDMLDTKKILEHLGRGAAKAAKTPVLPKGGKVLRVGGRTKYFSAAQLERNRRRTMARDESALEESRRRADIEVLGRVGGGIKGAAVTRFGLGGQSTGFAQNYKQDKNSGNLPAKPPLLKGEKPLGF